MAKKTVAAFKGAAQDKVTKVIRCTKTKNDAYTFKSEFVKSDEVEEYLKNLEENKK